MTIFVLTSRWPQNILLKPGTYFSPYSWWCSRYFSSLCATSKKSINPRWPPIVILNNANSFSQTDRESSFALIWYDSIKQTWYYTTVHLEALQASLLWETNMYLGVYLLFWRPSWIWHQDAPPPPPSPKKPHNFNTRNGFVALKLVELEALL